MVSTTRFHVYIVSDHVVIELVKKQVQQFEKDHVSWIIEGFPRTKTQALALQKDGIIPDRFMLLNIDRETSIAKLKTTLLHQGHFSGTADLERSAEAQLRDYEHNIQGVKDAFNSFIYEYNAIGRNQAEIANDLARILRIRFKSNGPRRPARVILLGPPGSGRSHQAQALSERFGLVYVCTRRLLKNEINSGSKAGKEIQKAIDEGKLVPDNILTPLID